MSQNSRLNRRRRRTASAREGFSNQDDHLNRRRPAAASVADVAKSDQRSYHNT